ncbi:hypothetical protein ERO13_D10G086550v2 [Gossypium hirsutum]|uniref:Uncharacterized protein n=2 Tax=Gossypium TaxID=3633 RepID=A0A5D2J346_GOSTO|nr:hypothetical protein ERO13_D10G086550v2 [Gossypium hirsutum]TYG49515.1 hypothetical protein ES288_D10G100400v1 [Gossypium darwinii]TYH48932.1 hypothetical protein ES332_D10G101400v1 [Gossypium tomentosum]
MSSIVGCNRLSASTNLKGHQVKLGIDFGGFLGISFFVNFS